jgi:small subunit ribosomal protein S21
MKKNKSFPVDSSIPPEMDYSYFSPVQVIVGNNFERAFKTFRSLVQSEGIIAKYKEKQSFEKPSDKKRRKKNEMIQNCIEAEIKAKKILSGEYEKEKERKQARKEKKRMEKEKNNG